MGQTNLQNHAVLFDMDGVLVSLFARWIEPMEGVFKKVKPDFNRKAIAESSTSLLLVQAGRSKNLMLNGIVQVCKLGGLSNLQTLRVIISLSFMFLFRRRKFKIVFLEGAVETLEKLKQKGLKLALVTSASRFTIKRIKHMYPEIYEYFDCIYTRSDVKQTKPAPDQILLALDCLNAKKKYSVIVGDFASDIIAGKKAGIKTIAVLGEYAQYSIKFLQKEEPDLIINNVTELPQAISKIFSS